MIRENRHARLRPIVMLSALVLGITIPGWGAGERTLENAASSPEELARLFLGAVAANDIDAAASLALTFEEYERYLWPELPEADPVRNLTANFVWDMTKMRGQARLQNAISHIGGRKLELVELRFVEGVREFPTFRIHRDPLLTLTDEEGQEQIIRLFGSVVELDGQFKLFSFNHD